MVFSIGASFIIWEQYNAVLTSWPYFNHARSLQKESNLQCEQKQPILEPLHGSNKRIFNFNLMKINVGDMAPDFTLSDQDGKNRTLSDHRGQWVLIYFYPKDDTPGCTVEACGLRDNLPKFKELDAIVLGISKDSVKSHAKFIKKFGLPFTLLSDEGLEVVKAYGVYGPKKFMGRDFMGVNRESFLIDPKGKVAKHYVKVQPEEHPEEVLNDLKTKL